MALPHLPAARRRLRRAAARGSRDARHPRRHRQLAHDRPQPRLRREHPLLAHRHPRLRARDARRGPHGSRLLLRRQAVRDRRARRHPPVHFAEGGDDVASIPLDRLILPGIVVDVSEQAAADPDYLVTAGDIGAWEELHGPVPAGAAVLIRTGWPDRWPDALAYLGDDTPGDASNLHFPGVGEDAARLLIEERGIGMLGIDTASVDYGQSTDFIVHQIGGAAGVPNLENVGDLSELPETGFLLVALPMKIEGGTGAPVRIVALVPR
ncbi:MAG: cyclase family protein [Acidobacteria bacterium]|nr:cyclase family protein [Acidobacteriota bacterium]